VVGQNTTHRDWIILDGSIKNYQTQSPWIERILTLFEYESRCLCLPNGENIQASNSELKYIIETDKINGASPALISRCQLINLSEDLVEDESILEKYLDEKFPKVFLRNKSHLLKLYELIFLPIVSALKKYNHQYSEDPCFLFKVRQLKVLTSDFTSILDILFDEFLKMCICCSKLPGDRVEGSYQSPQKSPQASSDSKQFDVYDKFKQKYSMKAQKAALDLNPVLDSHSEVLSMEALFIEGLKFTFSNHLNKNFHRMVLKLM